MAFGYTIFLVFLSSMYTNKSKGFPTREKATYNCSCENHGFSKFSPHACGDCPCALLMVIAKASSTGNCIRLNSFVVFGRKLNFMVFTMKFSKIHKSK